MYSDVNIHTLYAFLIHYPCIHLYPVVCRDENLLFAKTYQNGQTSAPAHPSRFAMPQKVNIL